MLFKAQQDKNISAIKVSRHALAIFHLLYANDVIIIFKATLESLEHVKSILSKFGLMSGLNINRNKYVVRFNHNTPRQFKRTMARFLGVRIVNKLGN